ncbi:hypothetical protein SAMN05444920_11685 [Nonomuraea solani]|uniref:SMI1-KNR4 cell-wall n=1 Tax=Nonomuraea solani TaxID=1144553 RepID=A0A1H6ETE9_9ACTN|nr:hypothetical protein SAMN05444920_11685 [Nonomuraea solani]
MAELGEELARIATSPITALPFSEIEALEKMIGAPLPEEFRSFLLDIGLGARPGPVLDLAWIVNETRREHQYFLEEPDMTVSPQQPFPITQTDVQGLPRLSAEGIESILWFDKPTPGTMLLCNHGCTWISMLALNGELAGTVWMTEMGWVEEMH